MTAFTESEIEILSLDELKRLGFSYIPGPSLAPDVEATQGFRVAESPAPYGEPEKRASYGDVVLRHTLEQAISRLNPAVPETARQEALKAALSVFSPQLIDANEAFHKMLAEAFRSRCKNTARNAASGSGWLIFRTRSTMFSLP
jgi:type I restriction enzyme R subunit